MVKRDQKGIGESVVHFHALNVGNIIPILALFFAVLVCAQRCSKREGLPAQGYWKRQKLRSMTGRCNIDSNCDAEDSNE